MNSVNKTLYIPLYGKAYVSGRGIILRDERAEEIWKREGFALKGRAKSRWLACFMAIRAAVYDDWVRKALEDMPNATVLHIGCGLDSRAERVAAKGTQWYDIDFPEVIAERRGYYSESPCYHMLPVDMRTSRWKTAIEAGEAAVVVLEGVSMYFAPEELRELLSGLAGQFGRIRLLMDCYSERAAALSRFKNPINAVGVTAVYGYDDPEELAKQSGLLFTKEQNMTPGEYLRQLGGMEGILFQKLFAGRLSRSMYKMYEFEKA